MATVGQRPDIESKIEHIAERIIRGRRAKDNQAVKIYRILRISTIVASAAASAGLSHPIISVLQSPGNVDKASVISDTVPGLPLWLTIASVLIYIALFVMRQWYHTDNIEKKAVQSLAAHDSFIRLEAQLEGLLEDEEPRTQLTSLHDNAVALGVNYADVMASRNVCRDEIASYAKDLINEKCRNWNSQMSPDERRK